MEEEEEGFEEWDADFLDQVIRVEERALSSSVAAAAPSQPPLPSATPLQPSASYLPSQPPPPKPQQSRLFVAPSHNNAAPAPISYSPPRELSQRFVDHSKPSDQYGPSNGFVKTALTSSSFGTSQSDRDKELEIERLKRELGRVSKQLACREQECTELKKERDTKEEQHKSAFSRAEGNRSGDYELKEIARVSQEGEHVKFQSSHQRNRAVESSSRAVGVQTDKAVESTCFPLLGDQLARQNLSQKLRCVWDPHPPFGCKGGSSIIAKLFVACHALFRCMGANISSKIKQDPMVDGISADFDGLGRLQPLTGLEVSKVSRFYCVLVKVSNGMASLEALLEPLVDLCSCEHVIVVHRSLWIMHLILKYLLRMERKAQDRDNVMAEELSRHNMNFNEVSEIACSSLGLGSSGIKARLGNQQGSQDGALTISCINWMSLLELLHRLIMKNKEEPLRLEAIAMMNLVLLGSNAYEREKFGLPILLESISELLKNGIGSSVQKEALHLLFLLLNCPKLLEAFCSFSKDSNQSCSMDDNTTHSNFQGSAAIMEGLAGCIACCGNSVEDLQLRRKAIVLLAFLASSGNAGFQILMNHKLSNGANFLMFILQALVLELDAEAAELSESPGVLKERTLFMREALILLNRLVSSPLYSSTSLRVLTSSRDMASLAIDIANRMSQKLLRSFYVDGMNKQPRETEIVDLARVFQRKLFTYLGDNIS